MRGPVLWALLLALLPGCPQTPREPDPEATEPAARVIARLGDPMLKGPTAERIELTKLAGVSRPALCLGSRGHFEITTPPRARRLQFSVGVKRGDEESELGNFHFRLLRPRGRQRPENLHTEVVTLTQLGWLEQSVALPASESGHRLRFEIFSGQPGIVVAPDPEGSHSGCWASIVVEGESTEP